MEDKYVKVGFGRENDLGEVEYCGEYIYRDETKTGLKVGDMAAVTTYFGGADIVKVLEINIPIEQVQEVRKNLFPGDYIKSIYSKY